MFRTKKIISEIINYKEDNNKFPADLKKINFPDNIDPTKIEYKTFNQNEDFYFSSDKNEFKTKFIYCSNENISSYCKPQNTREETISNIGDGWLKYEHDML